MSNSAPFDLKYGRRPVYLISTGTMLAITIWTAKMKTSGEVFAMSLWAGLASALNETSVQMTVCMAWDFMLLAVLMRFRSRICSLFINEEQLMDVAWLWL